MSRFRITPSFAVAVLALVVASGGAGFAAGQITSAQIKDGTIGSIDVRNDSLLTNDVKNGTLTGDDLRNRSVPRTKLATSCAGGEIRVAGGCVTKTPSTEGVPFAQAQATCARRNGRLPSIQELRWLQTQPGFVFGDPSKPFADYEFTGDYTTVEPITPVGIQRDSYTPVSNASAQYFRFHCITY